MRYFGDQVCLHETTLADYASKGGAITLTLGAVRPEHVTRSKGMAVSPSCDQMLACGQQFLVNGDLYVVLGLLWVGFGKLFKKHKSSIKKKNPSAPLLCLAVPQSCSDFDPERIDLFKEHLVLFVAHHVLNSAVFPVEKIRRRDITNMATVFSRVCKAYHMDKAFWKQICLK